MLYIFYQKWYGNIWKIFDIYFFNLFGLVIQITGIADFKKLPKSLLTIFDLSVYFSELYQNNK